MNKTIQYFKKKLKVCKICYKINANYFNLGIDHDF